MQRKTKRIPILRYEHNQSRNRLDRVAVEEPLEIRLCWQREEQSVEHSLSVTMRTPGHDFALAAGFLLTEGIIQKPDDISTITYCLGERKEEQRYNVVRVTLRPGLLFDPVLLQRNFYTTSSCGVCGRSSIEAVQVCDIPEIPQESPLLSPSIMGLFSDGLRQAQDVFEQTGGLHAAAAFSAQAELLAIYEDVGRHNAVDKLIGQSILSNQWPLSHMVLMVSGRISFDIVQKALRAGIPVVVAIGAPSSLAVELAESFGLTLIGFLREQRFNVYAGHQRIQ